MIKAKFNSHVRSKTKTAMKNEVLAEILCHNICCLIQAQFELGLAVSFWQQAQAHLPKPDLGRFA